MILLININQFISRSKEAIMTFFGIAPKFWLKSKGIGYYIPSFVENEWPTSHYVSYLFFPGKTEKDVCNIHLSIKDRMPKYHFNVIESVYGVYIIVFIPRIELVINTSILLYSLANEFSVEIKNFDFALVDAEFQELQTNNESLISHLINSV
jgi:hypothetical protein